MNKTVLITGADTGMTVHPGWMRTNMGGSDAPLAADESAEGIFQLVAKEWKVEDPIYTRLSWQSSALVRRTEWTFPTNAS